MNGLERRRGERTESFKYYLGLVLLNPEYFPLQYGQIPRIFMTFVL